VKNQCLPFIKTVAHAGGDKKIVKKVNKCKVSAGFHSRHFYSASTAFMVFRVLGVYPGKIATPIIEPGSVAS